MSSLRNMDSLDITGESLSEYLKGRYPERSFDDFSRLLTELVVELRSGGFGTIADVHKALERTKKAAKCFETQNPGSRLVGSGYSAIGIVIISIALLRDVDFFSFRTVLDGCPPEKLEEYGQLILPERDPTLCCE